MQVQKNEEPQILYIRITENCNARCFMCGFAKKRKPIYITNDQMITVVDEAKKSSIKLVRFTGGETLLDQQILSYLKHFKKNGIKTSIITNGFLLPHYVDSLIAADLDQIIVSIDGDNGVLHDKLRNLKGLFENAVKGIKEIKKKSKKIIVRVNTVASPYNLNRLGKMLDIFISLKVDQWSIIPLKGNDDLWKNIPFYEIVNSYKEFQKKVKNVKKPILLGYSKQWAGRNQDEIKKYFEKGVTIRPKNTCNLIYFVRFYNPFSNKLIPCNCVPWRLRNIDTRIRTGINALSDKSLTKIVNFYHENGPIICEGCEPTNAYLAEHPDILKKNIFLF